MVFIHSLHSEWLKSKRSTSFWLSVIGGFLLPTIQFIAYFVERSTINSFPPTPGIWQMHYNFVWQQMITFLLPMGVILSASLITQLEFKNNTWKQVHTTPQTYTTVFFAKLAGIMAMTLQFFAFFNLGVIISGYVPVLLIDGELPKQAFPLWVVLKSNARIFVTCLPIIAIQYLISLRFKNFIVPVGIGLVALITTMILVPFWKYAYLSPYTYGMLMVVPAAQVNVPINMYVAAIVSFTIITGVNYLIYINRSEKG